MFFKIVKEVDEESAELLRKAKANENMLRKLTNIDFLYYDLFDEAGKLKNKHFQNKAVIVNLGKIVQPEFGLINNFYGEAYGRSQASATMQENLVFSCGPHKKLPGLDFSVKNNETGSIKFQSVVLNTLVFDKNSGSYYNQLLWLLAAYFCDKKVLYTKIHDLLAFDKKNYSKLSNEAFVNNLILLFSAKVKEEKTGAFKITPSKTKEHFLKTKVINKNWLYLGQEKFYPKKYVNTFWYRAELETSLWLKGRELILITSYLDNNHTNFGNLEEKVKNPEFLDFINNKLNDLLKYMVESSNFGIAIYEMLKTKFLLSSI